MHFQVVDFEDLHATLFVGIYCLAFRVLVLGRRKAALGEGICGSRSLVSSCFPRVLGLNGRN